MFIAIGLFFSLSLHNNFAIFSFFIEKRDEESQNCYLLYLILDIKKLIPRVISLWLKLLPSFSFSPIVFFYQHDNDYDELFLETITEKCFDMLAPESIQFPLYEPLLRM